MRTITPNLSATPEQIAEFCRKWKITRFELFGSVLRDDFDDRSDIDVLATFEDEQRLRIRDFLDMEAELHQLFGRKVDLIERRLIEGSRNWIRRRNILNSAQLVYAAS